MSQSIWLTQNIGDNRTFNLPTLHGKETVKSKKLPIEIFIKCKTQQKIDGSDSDMVRKFFRKIFVHTLFEINPGCSLLIMNRY